MNSSPLLEIDSIPVSQLESDFGIGHTVSAERRQLLGIKSFSDPSNGRRKLITREDYSLFQEMDDYIKKGGSGPDFAKSKGLGGNIRSGGTEVSALANFTKFEAEASALIAPEVSEAIIQLAQLGIEYLKSQQQQKDPFWENLDHLNQVALNQYRIPTSRLLLALGLKSLPKLKGKNNFQKFGFKFTRCAREWSVEKI